MKTDDKKIKVCYVLAYKDPEYVRTRVLISALKGMQGVRLIKAINTNRSLVRYPETLLRVVWSRIRHRPDVYVIGFSGFEIFWPVRVLTWPHPIIFDEFINAYEWITKEHGLVKDGSLLSKILLKLFCSIKKHSHKVLTDTKLHAQSSSQTCKTPLSKYEAIYVGADEKVFKPVEKAPSGEFNAFFYGNFLPLHGIQYIVGAAKLVKDLPVNFVIVGGSNKPETAKWCDDFIKENKLSNVSHLLWVEYDDLPAYIARADICLGGPFGNTSQSQKVITGKTFQFLAMGKPVVVGKIKENAGFEDKTNVLVAKQGSTESLAKAIEWAYHNKDKLTGIAESGRKLYEEKFSKAVNQKKLEKIINGIN